jgi:hypothetical protein
MKLTEIIDIEKRKLSYDEPIKLLFNSDNLIGRGALGLVYQLDKDITSVVKFAKTRPSLEKDGYYLYLKEIIKMQDNPYVPQVISIVEIMYDDEKTSSKVKNFLDKLLTKSLSLVDDTSYIVVNLEKLDHLTLLTQSDYLFLFKKLFNIEISETDIKYMKWNIADILADILSEYINNRNSSYLKKYFNVKSVTIQDKQLNEVLNVIKKLQGNVIKRLIKKTPHVDLHSDNIMFRRTKFGPQLVIIDPLF